MDGMGLLRFANSLWPVGAGLALLAFGLTKRKLSWGKPLIFAGLVVIVVALFFGWPDTVEGFRAGYHKGATPR